MRILDIFPDRNNVYRPSVAQQHQENSGVVVQKCSEILFFLKNFAKFSGKHL